MSTEVTTEMMNITIARFMGMEGSDDFIRQNYKSHNSWELLMIVGKKIHDILTEMQKKRPPHTACHGDLIEVDIHCAVSRYDIVNAHKNMYIFIQWYNQQKQTNAIPKNNASKIRGPERGNLRRKIAGGNSDTDC